VKGKKGRNTRAMTVAVAVLAIAVGVARTCRKPKPVRENFAPPQRAGFSWPVGVKAAVSITFDHAAPSQLDRGLPILDQHGLKASFYLDIPEAKKRLADWRKAVGVGHEIGNHTLNHPCSGDYSFERKRGEKDALEDVTPEWVEKDFLAANEELKRMFGSEPKTFSYPCGEMFTGRGEETRSYVPLVARHFIAGRGFGMDFSNNPADCDLAKVNALAADGFSYKAFLKAIERAEASGDWVIFCGHGVGVKGGYPSISDLELEKLCAWLDEHRKEVWTGTVAEIAEYIDKARRGGNNRGRQ